MKSLCASLLFLLLIAHGLDQRTFAVEIGVECESHVDLGELTESDLLQSVVRVEGEELGSGFIISFSGLVLTAKHVIGNETSPEVTLPDGRTVLCSVVNYNDAADAALLQVQEDRGTSFRPLYIDQENNVDVNDLIRIVSFPDEPPPIEAVARIIHAKAVAVDTGPTGQIQAEVFIEAGSSGGAVVNSYGSVVGMQRRRNFNIALVSPSSALCRILPPDMPRYVVVVIASDTSTISSHAYLFPQHQTVTLTAPKRRYYDFVGWFDKDNKIISSKLEMRILPSSISGDQIVARYSDVERYLITATPSPDWAGLVDGAGIYADGSDATLVPRPNAGFGFAEWLVDGQSIGTDVPLLFEVKRGQALVARFHSTLEPEGVRSQLAIELDPQSPCFLSFLLHLRLFPRIEVGASFGVGRGWSTSGRFAVLLSETTNPLPGISHLKLLASSSLIYSDLSHRGLTWTGYQCYVGLRFEAKLNRQLVLSSGVGYMMAVLDRSAQPGLSFSFGLGGDF